ncbi:peptidoglycan-binding protein [Roseiarcaceae bacterium H3SJ34-1]|uniref:peptidoglycan-binding protein n=1 Tax=Terripilifer ovatus TaxID=3032367 RepID=UPI003AB956B2|nr:peptidoglycan-binding protein [Roseiarcaceae bacterium H3SJ34-1]
MASASATTLHLLSKLLTAASFTITGIVAVNPAAQAQPAPPAAQPASDPAFEAAKSAFEALPDTDRRAIQDALIWTGDYKSNVDGNFGRGTRDAIVSYARRSKLPANGTLDQKGRAALIAAGERAKAAQLFRKVTDTKSGAAVGLPTKFMTRRIDTRAGSKWFTADGSASLDTFQNPESQGDLPALFDNLRADAPGRRVTYRVLRPDFFVLTGEEQDRIFYTRAARGSVNGVATVRGYTLAYAKALKPTYDVISIAVANAFDPFPSAAPAVAGTPAAQTAQPAIPAAPPSAKLQASAIAVAPGLFLSVMRGDCRDPKIGARAANITKRDPANGLALIEARGPEIAALAPAAQVPAGGETVVALFVSQLTARDAETSVATGAYLAPASASAPPRLVAALQGNIGGTAVFDRSGRLIALAAAPTTEPKRIAGIIPQSAWALIPAAAITAFLDGAGVKPVAVDASASNNQTAGDIAGARRRAILPLTCVR